MKQVFIPGIFIVILLVFVFSPIFQNNWPTTPIVSDTSVQQVKRSITQSILYGDEKPSESTIVEIHDNESVLDILLRSKRIEVKEYPFGKLVESIEGISNGKNNKYWIFYINGIESTVGAGEYKPNANDHIEWKFKVYEK